MSLILLLPGAGGAGGGGPIEPPVEPPEPIAIDIVVQVRLSGPYEDMVLFDMDPVIYYSLNGLNLDSSGHGLHPTSAGSPTIVTGLLEPGNADDNFATSFDGVNDQLTAGDICEFAGLVPFTVSCWMQVAAIHATRTMRIVSKEDDDVNGQQGWSLSLLPLSHATHPGHIQFARVRNGSVAAAYSVVPVVTGLPHHVLAEFGTDLSVRVWLDGVIGTPVSSTQVMIEHTRPLAIGRHSFETTYFYQGILDELSIASGTPMTFARIAEHAAQGWSPVEDALTAEGIRIRYGIEGLTPIDCVAGPGECTFAVRNDAGNTGGLAGWYSPLHANVRPGWDTDIQFRVQITHEGITYTKFRGRLGAITPAPWERGTRRVQVTAYDLMHRLMLAGLRAIPAQVNQSDIDLLTAVMNAALDPTDEGLALTFAEGFGAPEFETYPYAFDDIARGTSAISALHDVTLSGMGFCYATGFGALRWHNRVMRASRTLVGTLNVGAMQGLTVTHNLEKAFNHVRITIHQRSIGAGNVVLWAWEGDPLILFPGETKEIWAEFHDLDDVRDLIGASTVAQSPAGFLLAGTDFAADALPDGTGADRTSSVTVAVEPFASSAKLTLHNAHATDDVYLVNNIGQTLLQVRGIPIYHDGDQTFEATTGTGNRQLALDLPYQVSPDVAQGLCNYLVVAYSDPLALESIELVGNRSNEWMALILAIEVGDRITVTEPMTGVTTVDAIVHSIEFSLEQGATPVVRCRWGLGPYLGDVGIAPPPPAVYPGGPGAEPSDLIVTYSGTASGTHNLSTDGPLQLGLVGPYNLAFNRTGLDVRVKGVAAGGRGGTGTFDTGIGGGGGGGGASHTTGVVVPITTLHYGAVVGSGTGTPGGATDSNTSFSQTTPAVTHLLLTGGIAGTEFGGGAGGTVTIGSGGVAGSAGGQGGNTSNGIAGASGTCGGGGGGGGDGSEGGFFAGGAGGTGTSQTGGAAVDGGGPTPASDTDAQNGTGGSTGAPGGGGGGVLLGTIYAGGGGGGGGGGDPSTTTGRTGGAGGQGVLTLTLVP